MAIIVRKDNQNSSHKNYWILLGIVLSLIFTIIVVLAACLFLRYLFRDRRRGRSIVTLPINRSVEEAARTETGLDASAIAALPTFVYTRGGDDSRGQCSVCLCPAKEREVMRMLPSCNHSFHVKCIDMWLHSHSRCPICRGDARLPPAASIESLLVERRNGSLLGRHDMTCFTL